ncbi:hypothetical protein SLA2020_425160 [Shorea laevis]
MNRWPPPALDVRCGLLWPAAAARSGGLVWPQRTASTGRSARPALATRPDLAVRCGLQPQYAHRRLLRRRPATPGRGRLVRIAGLYRRPRARLIPGVKLPKIKPK